MTSGAPGPSYAEILRGAEAIAARAAAALVDMQGQKLAVSRKELLDVVTDADLASERIVLDGIRALTPDAAILSEEAGASGDATGLHATRSRWIVDPLDGTVNYAAGLPWYSVTMAYQHGGVTRAGIVHAPAMGMVATYAEGEGARVNGRMIKVSATERLSDAVVSVVLTSHFTPEEVGRTADVIQHLGAVARGVRVIVSGGLEMCLVASGQLDAWISLKADTVSHAAAMLMVRDAGGRVTRLDGSDADDEDTVRVASNGVVHQELSEALSSALAHSSGAIRVFDEASKGRAA